MNTSNLEV